MAKLTVLVVGHGKLVQELLKGLCSPGIFRVAPWEEREGLLGGPGIVIHAGSGRELADVITFCSRAGSTLLELSTQDPKFPEKPSFPVILSGIDWLRSILSAAGSWPKATALESIMAKI